MQLNQSEVYSTTSYVLKDASKPTLSICTGVGSLSNAFDDASNKNLEVEELGSDLVTYLRVVKRLMLIVFIMALCNVPLMFLFVSASTEFHVLDALNYLSIANIGQATSVC